MTITKRTPDSIVCTYIALLKNNQRTVEAIEKYYSDTTSVNRAKLVQEIARCLRDTLSVRIRLADRTVADIFDKYNTIEKIKDEGGLDIDFSDSELLSIFGSI